MRPQVGSITRMPAIPRPNKGILDAATAVREAGDDPLMSEPCGVCRQPMGSFPPEDDHSPVLDPSTLLWECQTTVSTEAYAAMRELA
jgi:cytidine deaminase